MIEEETAFISIQDAKFFIKDKKQTIFFYDKEILKVSLEAAIFLKNRNRL